MSALVSPAAGLVALPAKVALPSVLAPGAPSLAVFVDLMIGTFTPPAVNAATGGGERQSDADTGKDLPAGDDKKDVDPALAWLFAPMPFQQPEPSPKLVVVDPRVNVTADPTVENPEAIALPRFPALDPPRPAAEPVRPMVDPALDPAVVIDKSLPSSPAKPRDHTVLTVPLPPRAAPLDNGPRLQIPLPTLLPPCPVAPPTDIVQAALLVLGAGDRDIEDEKPAPITLDALRPMVSTPTAVVPTGDTQRQSLDMGNRDWPQKMIDHIETLRDHADAADTSIRLKPEALGRVDVSLRSHENGAVSVRFIAEQPATRTLLIDAAPQLAAAAEARGIRLSGTSVDLSGQGEQRPRPQVDRRAPITNRVAPTGDESEADPLGRIA